MLTKYYINNKRMLDDNNIDQTKLIKQPNQTNK